jgi:hypothetical protein
MNGIMDGKVAEAEEKSGEFKKCRIGIGKVAKRRRRWMAGCREFGESFGRLMKIVRFECY